jgi:hypothetical protein
MDTKRHIALPDDLWAATKVQAAIEGVGARIIVIRSLRTYLERPDSTTTIGVTPEEVEHRTAPPLTDHDIQEAADRIWKQTYRGFGASHPAPKPTKKATAR